MQNDLFLTNILCLSIKQIILHVKKVTNCCKDCQKHIQFCVKPHVNYIALSVFVTK